MAIATVVETWGSAPQPVGSQLVIDAEGNFIGSVSGGCVEGAVVTEALDIIATGKPKLLQFGVADETAWQVGPGLRRPHRRLCGAAGVKRELLEAVLAARRERQAVALITDLASGSQRLVPRVEAARDPLAAVLDEAFRFDQSGSHDGQFVNIHNPPLRLVIIGAVHIAQAVIPMAQQLGYDVTVIDPRGAFATGARFPGIALIAEWPDEVIPRLGLDPRTALIALTHDPKIDDPALNAALQLGRLLHRRAGLEEDPGLATSRGWSRLALRKPDIARIHGPIGLNIGAKGAPEIAVSIMAEMTRALRLGE